MVLFSLAQVLDVSVCFARDVLLDQLTFAVGVL